MLEYTEKLERMGSVIRQHDRVTWFRQKWESTMSSITILIPNLRNIYISLIKWAKCQVNSIRHLFIQVPVNRVHTVYKNILNKHISSKGTTIL